MSVFRKADLEWKGQTYTVEPTMALLSRIERSGISLVSVAASAADGKPQIILMSQVMGFVMRDAGIAISDEELYQEMMNEDAASVVGLWNSIFAMISPAPKEGKKQDAHGEK